MSGILECIEDFTGSDVFKTILTIIILYLMANGCTNLFFDTDIIRFDKSQNEYGIWVKNGESPDIEKNKINQIIYNLVN